MPVIEDEVAAAGTPGTVATLERLQDLLRIAAAFVGELHAKAKTPDEARFIVAHVRDAVDHWQPANTRPDKPRGGRDGD